MSVKDWLKDFDEILKLLVFILDLGGATRDSSSHATLYATEGSLLQSLLSGRFKASP
jgi:hypothetical protein